MFLVVGDIRGQPVGFVGVPAGDHTGSFCAVIDGDRDAGCGQVCTDLEMYRIIVLCDLHPIRNYPTARVPSCTKPVVAFLRGDFDGEPCT